MPGSLTGFLNPVILRKLYIDVEPLVLLSHIKHSLLKNGNYINAC